MNNNYIHVCRKNLLHELNLAFKEIKRNYKYIKSLSKAGEEILGSGEWLLDNIYLIEKEYKNIKENMPREYFDNLPLFNEGDIQNVPRILIIAKEYIKKKSDSISELELISFIRGKNIKFTMGELWAFPLILRIALIIKLSKLTNKLVEMQRSKIIGKYLAYEIIDSLEKNRLDSILNKIEANNKINSLVMEELIKVLKDNSIEDERIYSFIKVKVKIGEVDGIDVADKVDGVDEVEEGFIRNTFLEGIIEQSIGGIITSLREIEALNWRNFFNETSEVERLLKQDPDGTYELMDFESKDYYRHKIEYLSNKFQVDEIVLTEKILFLARRAKEKAKCAFKYHVGYYIIDEGLQELADSFNSKVKMKNKYSADMYIFNMVFFTAMIITLTLGFGNIINLKFKPWQYILAIFLMIVPASEIVVSLSNWIINKKVPIRLVPKLDYSKGIPKSKKTIIVIPAILPNKERTVELVKQLEVIYLANKYDNLYFALLGDFKDSKKEKEAGEEEIIEAALKEVLRLNMKYFSEERHFFFFNRSKIFNKKQNVYMGRERKRGKIMEFISLLKESNDHTFNVFSSNFDILKEAKYIITLDADTFMPRDTAVKMIGAMAHVLNKPLMIDKTVRRGYGIMQPKISINLESVNKSKFTELFAGEGGIDAYSIAYSDTYQDMFGEGIFTGKGIIDIDTFNNVLRDKIPNDAVLSHDLLEGALVRCALISDVELIDGYPASYEASCKRLHRWVRGDWQLLKWITSIKINALSRWKIVDNLRRSLLSISLLLVVLSSSIYFNGSLRILLVCFLAAILPLVFTVTDFVVTPKTKLSGTFKSFNKIVTIISFIPYQGYLMFDAIIRTIFRLTISKKNLLQWQTAEEAERNTNNSLKAYLKRMWFAIFMAGIIIALSIYNFSLASIVNLPIGFLWITSPYIAFYISKENVMHKEAFSTEEIEYLRDNSRRIWAYYQDFVNYENNYLAPDNFQESPYKGVAPRTSPTNIGMGLTSSLAAYDLGYITVGEVIDRLELIINEMETLPKYKGHFFNWYDTRTKEPLWPRYISTVDSGNLLGYLLITKEALMEYEDVPIVRKEELTALEDAIRIINEKELNSFLPIDIKGNFMRNYKLMLENLLIVLDKIPEREEEEKQYWIDKLKREVKSKLSYFDIFFLGIEKFLGEDFNEKNISLRKIIKYLQDILMSSGEEFKDILRERIDGLRLFTSKIDRLLYKINTIIEEMDFGFLFNEERKLFSIGYNLEENSLGNSYYDLLASESRATSFIAIALNMVPQEHWFRLNRAMTNAFKEKSLVSWSGTMFEYFMPTLIMKNYDNTILDLTYTSVIEAQRKFAMEKKLPWGISESAYYHFDIGENYQYKAFGVPGIGMKRGLEDEVVISPYSTLITLPFTRSNGIKNLKKLRDIGAYGRYGFIEAIDYTSGRVNKSQEESVEGKKVRCYMVHHLGMSLMALDNVLNSNIFQERFHRMPEVKATELLLKEKIPNIITFENEESFSVTRKKLERENFIPRMFDNVKRENPEVLLLSNGRYSTMVTLAGSGYSKKDSMTIYRWKADNTSDASGLFFYIKDLTSKKFWSATYEPCKIPGDGYSIEFTLDKAKYYRKDGDIETILEVVVSPEDDLEIRKITLKNLGNEMKNLEVTSYMEVTLQSFEGDAVHPAFSNLFISTEYINSKECLLGYRRSRTKDGEVPYIFHKAIFQKNIEEETITYETARVNFIGRNRDLSNPRALDNDVALINTVGTVLDPIMSIRTKVTLNPNEEKNVYYITGTAKSREKALELVDKYSQVGNIHKSFDAYNRSIQIELKHLGIKSSQANIYQSLASYILFLHTGREDREDYIKNITKNQQDLWAYGISGDLPIALALVKSEEDMDLIRGMLKMHYYWRIKGLKVDLIIYNNEESSYEQPLHKNIMGTISFSKEVESINKPGGIHIYNKSTMPQDMLSFLIGISNLYVDSEKGSIITQIKAIEEGKNGYLRLKELDEDHKIIRIKDNVSDKDDKNKLEKEKVGYSLNENLALDFWNGYGGFDPKDKGYIIKLDNYRNTPAPWINVISNENFGFHISESGAGYTWCENSRENKITPWSNDWISDPITEGLYIKEVDKKKIFSISPKPIRDPGEYIIKHSFGYSTFKHRVKDIKGEMKVFVPRGEKLKVIIVELENLCESKKELSIYYYAQLVLGVFNSGSARYISTEIKEDYILGSNAYSKYFGEERAYLSILGGENIHFTGDRKEFIGPEGDIYNPEGMKDRYLSNRSGGIFDPALIAQVDLTLQPREVKKIVVLLGEEGQEKIEEVIEKYKNIENSEIELEKIIQYWSNFLGNIQVKTKDKSMDYLLNGWLLYQNYSCRYLSRSAFYQSGGAYGFRDQLQDSMSLGIVDSEITRTQILRSASRQYIEGDVQHWWHPVVNSGIRTRFSDDLLWLPFVTVEYINRTGDYSILKEEIAYLEDEPLHPGEDERYTIVNNSNKKGSIYEHCLKAINKSLNFGKHNIPLMGSGDWNDGMSTVGNKGKGESVWLGWFLYYILNSFEDICKYMKDDITKEEYKDKKEFIRENLERNAWDGGWYRRAYFDDGIPLGSRENEECKIDSLAQSWAVISGAAKRDRAIEAMKAVDRNLVNKDRGMILLLSPPFDKSKLEPGYIKGYVPGVRENGGQYTHAAVWVILALTKLGLGDKAYKYYNMINPINHTKTELECRNYKVEPYVMAADIYIKDPHAGRGGWSWYTGAAGWMYKVGIEDILGLRQIKGRGYKVEPSIPKDWQGFNIFIKNDTEDYSIEVRRGEKRKVLIDNLEIETNIIPKDMGKVNIIVYI